MHMARIWYVVAPAQDRWQVTFGCDRQPGVYATQDEALMIARSAARLHWENQQAATGARLDLPGGLKQVLATFGRVAAPSGALALAR
jgi:hypothetical protein